MLNLEDKQWSRLNSHDIMLGSLPFHILNDGYLLIVKDKTKVPRELTEEEVKNMGVIYVRNSRQ